MFFQARSTIRDLDPTNDITFLRLRSKKNEVLIAPGNYVFDFCEPVHYMASPIPNSQ